MARWTPRRRRRDLLLLVLATATAGAGLALAPELVDGRSAGPDVELAASTDADDGTSSTTTSSAPSTTVTTTAPATSTADPEAAAVVAAARSGTVEWALVDLATGEAVGSGTLAEPQHGMDAASMGKVLIAVAAVEQGLTDAPGQLALVEVMIEQSDNEAASALYRSVGGATAIQELMGRAGMTSSTVGRNWGAMNITASDMAAFLAQVASGSLLGTETELVLEPMRDVIASQRWGIAEAATADPTTAVKNGWYPDTDGMWRLHCSAIVGDAGATTADQGVAVVVMTHYSQELGMGYGEDTCRLVAAALLPDALVT